MYEKCFFRSQTYEKLTAPAPKVHFFDVFFMYTLFFLRRMSLKRFANNVRRVNCANSDVVVSWTVWISGHFVEIIEFLGKILLEDYTLTYFEPKCTQD
jgi:hypothetical protein